MSSLSGKPFINVHTFDGKLPKITIRDSSSYSPDEQKNLFTTLKNSLTQDTSKQMIDLITCSSQQNFQPESGMNATDLLIELLLHVPREDLLPLLDEQLTDMFKLGQCPSGRVTRLYQLHQAFVSHTK